jgi:hypothetical protein
MLLIALGHFGSKTELKSFVTSILGGMVSKSLEKSLEKKLKLYVTTQVLAEKLKHKANTADLKSADKEVPKSASLVVEELMANPQLLKQLRGKLEVPLQAEKPDKIQKMAQEQQKIYQELSGTVTALKAGFEELKAGFEELRVKVRALESGADARNFNVTETSFQPLANTQFGRSSDHYTMQAQSMIIASELRRNAEYQGAMSTAFGLRVPFGSRF